MWVRLASTEGGSIGATGEINCRFSLESSNFVKLLADEL